MDEILVLAEHREGELRDITFEMLSKARSLGKDAGKSVTALLLGAGVGDYAEALKSHADEVLVLDHGNLKAFNAAVYQQVLSEVLKSREPSLVMIGHTAFGVDLAPGLAVTLELPFASDCIDLAYEGDDLKATRQIYEGKVNATVSFADAPTVLVTFRPSACPVEDAEASAGKVTELDVAVPEEPAMRQFLEYVEAAVGEVDITKADVVVSIGRGLREEENLPMIEELAEALGGVVACSRPCVDAGWLPKDRQVGSSGKTVKPKLYLAIGISGQFQHLSGMKAADTIVAVNKDPKAPIFSEADYGIVGDLMKVVPALKEKIAELRA
ncbi:MAG: electron transfer flavoprotein subunit alpha/FixB family protein [Candidatus Eisenbacteria bacterium]|nr:electron transfer flavoprotein subunit alpha/FixB family protein [Candidatus Eisenbacteria bacterium]